jgi:hypothetical protein
LDRKYKRKRFNFLYRITNKKISYWLEKLHLQQDDKDKLTQSLQDRGIDDATQSMHKQTSMDKKTVENMVRKSNRILLNIRSHKFPFDLFPNTINVEETRVTFITRSFSSSQVHSVDIKDISNVFINFAPFFAQLVIISKTFSENNMQIDNLYKKEAIHTRRIIEGLRMFEEKKVDTSAYSSKELVSKLEELSTTKIEQ